MNDLRARISPTLLRTSHDYRIAAVAAGGLHSALVTDSGHLLMFGSNAFGQLCTEGPSKLLVPTSIKALRSLCVTMLALGLQHTLSCMVAVETPHHM